MRPSPHAAALVLATLTVCPVRAALREIWYNVTYATANPDGLQERRVIGLNGTWPPPPIEIFQNDTLVVHAFNGLGDVLTAVHHHGMFFNSSSWYDGAVGVSQCGIPPGQNFNYVVDTAASQSQTGTYWYHSHFGGQYVDGFRAPLIIKNANETYKYDEEYIVAVSDWYHDEHSVLLKQFLSESNPTGAEPVPDSGIIQISQNATWQQGYSENATLSFTPGKTYRLRLINMSALAMFSIHLDGHNMTVIEVDGTDVQPYPLDVVTMSAAQRVSILVTARNDTDTNYLFHADMSPDMFDSVPDSLNLNITSTIAYNGNSSAAALAPASTIDEYTEFPDWDMVPLIVEPQVQADVSVQLNAFFATASNGNNRAFFNNVTYVTPLVPTILTAVSMGQQAYNPDVYAQTNTFVLTHGQTVQIELVNWDVGYHPFHLHGHKMQLVGMSMDVTSSDPAINPPVAEGQANPMRRDTVMVPPGGSRSLRFRADNPGTWFFHCHIEWHLQSGLAAVFVEALDTLQTAIGAPAALRDQCTQLGFATSGNAAGHNSTTDFSGLSLGPYPQQLGWTPKAIGALTACIITALLGLLTVVWYTAGGQLDEDELELEVAEAIRRKEAKGGKIARAKKLFSSKSQPKVRAA